MKRWGGEDLLYETYEPHEKQQRFHAVPTIGPKLIKLFAGALGSGKSTACMNEQAVICMKTPGGMSLAIRKSVTRSDLTLIEDYKKILRGQAFYIEKKQWFEFPNGHKLALPAADMWDRFGSLQLVSFYIQEAQELPWKIVSTLIERVRAKEGIVDGVNFLRGLMCARPVKRSHWIYSEFYVNAWDIDTPVSERAKKNPAFVIARGKSWDNEKNLAPGYIQGLLRDHQGDMAYQRMMIEGEFGFDIDGRPVFDCYDPDVHDAEIEEDPTLPIYRGVDFGYNRPAVVWAQFTRTGRLLILRELTPDNTARHDMIAQVEALQKEEFPDRHPGFYRDFGDIAGEQPNSTGVTDIEFWESHFQQPLESRKARVEEGLEELRRLMTSTVKVGNRLVPRFQVDVRCDRLREALGGGYHYKMDKTDEGKTDERPVKGHGYDDVVDAVRFIAHSLTGVTAESEATRTGDAGAAFGSW